MTLAVSPYSITAGGALPQMPVMVNVSAIPSEETPAPAQAPEKIPFTKAVNVPAAKMDNMMKAFVGLTFQLSTENEPGYGRYRTDRAYPIQADFQPLHTAMNFPPPNPDTGLTS